jgi:[ribosomal protein S18]-alanine N-acetyltransferase
LSGGSPIEEVGETYAAALAAIHAAAFSPPAAWGEAAMAALLAGPGCFGLIDHRGGCALVRVIGEEAELLTLAVACSARRQGIGSGLLHAAMARAARSGATAIFLEVSKANRAACALYTAAGFLEIGRRRGYYFDGTDAVVLRAPLDCCSGASAAPPQQQ